MLIRMNLIKDFTLLFKNLEQRLQPCAKKKNINLNFSVSEKEIRLCYRECELMTGFTKLIGTIIDYMPDDNTIYLNTSVIEKLDAKYLSIKIRNTGINLKMVTAIIKCSALPVALFSFATNETTFEVCFSLKYTLNIPVAVNGNAVNYTSVVKGIQTYFAKLNNPVARLADTRPKEAAFLTTINKCILDNIGDERFDANALSNAMYMSRAQLLRRLKSLIGNSPGFYIKTMRLEKAKQLLQTSDLSISEAAYKTGFGTASNFTKVFSEKYGITPSQFRKINSNATNE
jgi:AraC-like DNA-binding protein